MLEFVHLSGAEAGKDLQTRRKVRSQAMRDFRRRQREEREAANKTGSAESTKALLKSRSLSGRQRDRSSSVATFETSERRSMSSTVPSPSVMPLEVQRSKLEPTDVSLQQPMITLYGDYFNEGTVQDLGEHYSFQIPQPPDSDLSHWNPATERDPQTYIPRTPSAWMTEIDDPFQSPAHLNQMFAFCKSYVQWLRPGTDPEHAGNTLAEAWDASHSATLSAACCLASVGHLDAVQPNRPGGKYALYKARVLRGVTESMRHPDSATSDVTIGCLAMLTSYEMSRCSGEAATHLAGLKSILSMKGSAKAQDYPGLAGIDPGLAGIETLDLLHAVIFDSPLLIIPYTGPRLSTNPSTTDNDVPPHKLFARLVVVLSAEREDFLASASSSYHETLVRLPELLDNVTTSVKDATSEDALFKTWPDDGTPMELETFRSNIEIFIHTNADDPDAVDASNLANACYFTLAMFHSASRNRRDGNTLAQRYVGRLYAAVQRIRDSTWKSLPYLRLLILLRGATTARDPSMKSFFKAQLVRAIYQMGPSERRRMKNFVMDYLEVTNKLERSQRKGATSPATTRSMSTSNLGQTHLNPGWPRHTLPRTGSTDTAASLDNGSLYNQSPFFGSEGNTPIYLSLQSTPYLEAETNPFFQTA